MSKRYSFKDDLQNPRKRHGVQTRMKCLKETRILLESLGYLEVQTPLLVPSPGMDPHIRPFQIHQYRNQSTQIAFLPTSPEFAMKRLLAGGIGSIFQVSQTFRDEPSSTQHFPEFTMIEFYKINAKLDDLMKDVERFLESLFSVFPNDKINFKPPFERFTTRQLFLKHTGIELMNSSFVDLEKYCQKKRYPIPTAATWDDLYYLIWLNEIETVLPLERPYFVTEYPASQAALSETGVDEDGFLIAHRFEIYAGGFELGNAFQELTDAQAQRDRFIQDMSLRERIYGPDFPKTPIDEGFLNALNEGLPPCSGIAMGFDRLVMLAAKENDIAFTHWLSPFAEADYFSTCSTRTTRQFSVDA